MSALDFRGPHREFLHDKTAEIDLEETPPC
jgi:hypothetical protein